MYISDPFWKRNIFHEQGVACAKTARPHGTGARKKTVELRDWGIYRVTAGAIRLTSRLPVLSLAFAKRSWNQVPALFVASRRAGRDAGNDIECPTRAIRMKRKVNGINVPCSRQKPNNSDFAGMSLLIIFTNCDRFTRAPPNAIARRTNNPAELE